MCAVTDVQSDYRRTSRLSPLEVCQADRATGETGELPVQRGVVLREAHAEVVEVHVFCTSATVKRPF